MIVKKKKRQVGLNIAFIAITLCYIIPFLLIVSVSFSDETSIMRYGYSLIPHAFSNAAYRMVFRNPTQILNSYRTTIIFTIVATVLGVLVMGILAYPMSRSSYKYGKFLAFYVLFTMLFNGGMVPTYILLTKYLSLKNSIWVYILPALVQAYYVIIIRTNYKSLPEELIEAAKLDGASEFYICTRVVMPLCKPVLASVAFLFFVGKWNDWYTALLYIDKSELYSLQYLLQKILNSMEYLNNLAKQGSVNMDFVQMPTESYRYAMAIVAAGPVLVVFPFFQKYFSKGMLLGGVKG